MNKVILVGRLSQDPEVRYTQNGKAVASFSIAVNRFAGSGQKESTDFIPIVAWEKLAEICGNNLTKGRRVLVEGRLQIRSYETADGQKRRVAEVVAQNIEFLDSKQASGGAGGGSGAYDAGSFGSEVFPEEEIPF
ncbi:single-stranded DNA-binding protein|uniref:Single-stranded DNA-binding protein n=1 Tax=Dendrosporobacter quercicolus TaxID=146817 RepID=A0A1G9XZ29_9FIRM|nr:single-stranded DNA-binding protein [Dendrosporobacter quercicolus]NSL49036.1 single-stranded DNA-binding protein [Dendrosporobacter quercicolus DSM 1736]SDN02000.1 single-strand binding protein [Dendrosporobacter quercicolus]